MNRRARLASAVGAAGLVSALLVALPHSASAAAGNWAATSTGGLANTNSVRVEGAAPAGQQVKAEVGLQLRNRPQLEQAIAAHRTFSRAQFLAGFAPTAAQVKRTESYLRSQGIKVSGVTGNRVLITAVGSVNQMEKAFHTDMSRVAEGSRTGLANTTPVLVPAALKDTVAAVVGLNTLYRASAAAPSVSRHGMGSAEKAAAGATSCTLNQGGVAFLCSYNPQGFWQAYDANSAPTGSGTTVGIFAEGDLTGVISDLRAEETANDLPQVTVNLVPTGPASSDTSGADEWDMDTQYSTGMAGTVKSLTVYDAPSLDDADLSTEFQTFASADNVKAASASFGECEFQAQSDGSMAIDDEAFEEAAAQGQTVFSSAGDTGGFCSVGTPNGVPLGVPDVNYPASSPYVIGVGGTTLLTKSNGAYDAESAWLAGGGGVSYFEKQPTWQAGDGVVGELAGKADLRTVPDVAMDADPDSGANVYVSGTPETVGGTSLASPLALGVWARLESGHSNDLGFAAPLLYAANGTAAFHDIVLGDTGPYPATPGYDLATGIGTFDVAQAESIIK